MGDAKQHRDVYSVCASYITRHLFNISLLYFSLQDLRLPDSPLPWLSPVLGGDEGEEEEEEEAAKVKEGPAEDIITQPMLLLPALTES